MADASFTQTSFLGGEWSPYMQGRFDRQDYRTAMNVCLNSFPLEEGSWTRRPGTRRLAPTRKGLKAVLREFHFAELQPYLLEFSALHMRMWAGTSLVLDGVLGKFVVAAVSTATPAVVTTLKPHGMSTGDEVQFEFPSGVSIPTAAPLMNHQFEITVIDANNFSLANPITGASINGTGLDLKGNVILVGRILDLATSYPDTVLQNIRVVQGQDTDGTGVAVIMRATQRPIALRVATKPAGCVPATFNIGPAAFVDGPYMDAIADGSTITPSGLSGGITLTVTPGALTGRPGWPTAGFNTIKDPGRLIRLRSEPAAWASATAYAKGDHVKFADTYWTASVANTGKQPDQDPVNWGIDPAAARWTWGEIQTVSSPLVCTIQLKGNPLLYLSPITQWRMGLYSENTAWPTNGTFHEGRLWLAGAQDNRFDGSKSNDFFNFAPTAEDGTVADDNGIGYVLNSKDVNPIFWMDPDDNGIVMGTQGGEWHVRASQLSDPLTPTSEQAKRVSKYGCANVEPRRTNLSLLLVQKDQTNLIEYVPDPSPGKYSGQNIALKGKHLTFPGIEELAVVELTTPIVWARTTAGNLIGCTYNRDNPYGTNPESFSGWHRHALAADPDSYSVFSIQSGPSTDGKVDALSLVVNDTTTGVYYVERLTPIFEEDQTALTAWFLDHAIRPPAAEVNGSNIRLWGLNDYAGKTVQVWGAGLDLGDYVVQADGHIDVPVDAVGSNFTSAYLATLTAASDSFTGFAVTITRPTTGAVPTPASANTINEYTPAFPSVSSAGVAVNWDASSIWIMRAGNTGNGLLQFSLAGGAAGATKTITNIFGSEGGGQQFVQQPIAYCGDGVSLFWSPTSSNSGPVVKYNPASGTTTTLGSSNAALTNTSAHLMKGLTLSRLTAGANYMVIPSLVGSPGISNNCSVAVVNTDAMTFFDAVSLLGADQRGVSCSGPTADFDCYHSGSAYILGGFKPSVVGDSATSLSIYNYTISVWGTGTPTGTLTKMGSFSPANVDATWTHFSTWHGIIHDETDHNVIAGVHISVPSTWAGGTYPVGGEIVKGSNNHAYKNLTPGNSGINPTTDGGVNWQDLGVATYTNSDYIIKINSRTGAVMWAVAVGSIPSSADDWNECRVQNGKFAYVDGAGTGIMSVITTSTGAVVTTTLTGLSKGGPVLFDDVTGRIVMYMSGYTNSGTIQPTGVTPTSFSNAWATLASSGALVKPVYNAPFVVGFTYTSDGQIVRPIHPAEAGAQNGPALAKTRRAHMMTAVMHSAKGISFGTVFTKMHSASLTSPGGTPLTTLQLYSGTYWNTLEDDYSFDSMLCWRITRPYPATVLAVGTFLHTQDR